MYVGYVDLTQLHRNQFEKPQSRLSYSTATDRAFSEEITSSGRGPVWVVRTSPLPITCDWYHSRVSVYRASLLHIACLGKLCVKR